jgi:arylsulfatase A-like enzyme
VRVALSDRVPRVPAALPLLVVGIGAAAVAWRSGGGADARETLPHPSIGPGVGSKAEPGRGGEAYEVRTRLVEALGEAHVDAPNLAAAEGPFESYWRKMRGPWSRFRGVAGQLVTTLSLRTSAEETQWTVTTDEGTWTPEARVWNMNEGSYDQREAIFAPAPATLTFRVAVPPRAHLRFSPAVAAPFAGPTQFDVVVIDAGGEAHAAFETRLSGADARRWHDEDLDMSPWSGQQIDLILRTSTDDAMPAPPPLALWGDPILVAKEPTRLPYDVLWIVVDALRPDVAAGLHDPDEDHAALSAPRPPLEALLPAVPGLMPSIDALAARGVHFEHAWSAATWTRPGTLAMLTGARSSEIGLDTTAWLMPAEQVRRYYGSDPPLLPLVLRKSGAVTAAFVNNFFMSGYSVVGVDMGFERLTDHRYRTRDTAEITGDAVAWLEAHVSDRFFLFVNFNSPHQPYDPPPEMLARVPDAPSAGPHLESQIRQYMAEGAKDDHAIGVLLDKLDSLDLRKTTLVVVTADHGETLSSARTGLGIGGIPLRFHHAVGNFEETTRIPIVMALPGVLDGGGAVTDRVRNVDIAPTVLDVEGLEADPRMSGRSMLPLVRGRHDPEPRAVVSEGRGSRAILWGSWRLTVHDPAPRAAAPKPGADDPASGGDAPVELVFEDELYDHSTDPGERHNVARQHPEVVADLRARLVAALANAPAADATASDAHAALPTLRVRFAGAGRAHRVSGALTVGDGKHPAAVVVDPVGIARENVRIEPRTDAAGTRDVVDFALATSPDAPVGFDVRVDPPGTPVGWQLFLDDAPWPEGLVFTGPFGLAAVAAKTGMGNDEARAELYAPAQPAIDPMRDLGVFFTRDRPEHAADDPGAGVPASGEAAKEMQRMLQDWGYAHAPEHEERRTR